MIILGKADTQNWINVEVWLPLNVAVIDARQAYQRQYGEMPDMIQVEEIHVAGLLCRDDFAPVADPVLCADGTLRGSPEGSQRRIGYLADIHVWVSEL